MSTDNFFRLLHIYIYIYTATSNLLLQFRDSTEHARELWLPIPRKIEVASGNVVQTIVKKG